MYEKGLVIGTVSDGRLFPIAHIWYAETEWTDISFNLNQNGKTLSSVFSIEKFDNTLFALVSQLIPSGITPIVYRLDGNTWTPLLGGNITPQGAPFPWITSNVTQPGKLVIWNNSLWALIPYIDTSRIFSAAMAICKWDGSVWHYITNDSYEYGGTLSVIPTSRSGASELAIGYWGADLWATFDGTTFTQRDNNAASCVWVQYDDPNGYLHSVDEYGFTYLSNDARSWRSIHVSPNNNLITEGYNENINGFPDTYNIDGSHSLWALFKIGSQLYGATCSKDGTPCDIRKWLGTTWIGNNNQIISIPTKDNSSGIHYSQGFTCGVSDGNLAYVGSGVPWYNANNGAFESKVYSFDGTQLIEITNDNGDSMTQFDCGVQTMCYGRADISSGWHVGYIT